MVQSGCSNLCSTHRPLRCISYANQYIDLSDPEDIHIREVKTPPRPSTFCDALLRGRNFYIDREKLVGKTFPTLPIPRRTPRLSHAMQRRTPDPRDQVLARIRSFIAQSSQLVRIATAQRRPFPLHDGSKSPKVDTVWSMRYTSCTNLGNRGARQAVTSLARFAALFKV